MGAFVAIMRRQLGVLWTSPVPYVTGAVFHAALGLLATDTMQVRQEAVFQPVVPIAGFLLLIAVPALAMRSLADDRRIGMLDLIGAVPVPAWAVVAGTWCALVVTTAVVIAPIGLHAALLAWWGDPDPGPIVTGLIGLSLLGCAGLAVGLVASALTRSQAVAGIGATFVLLAGWFLRPSDASVALGTITARLSLNERLRGFAAGGIDVGAATFLLAVTVVGLLAAIAIVGAGHRRPHRRRTVVALSAVGAVVLVALQWGVDDSRRFLDLTAEDSLSLTSETGQVVAALDEPVRITAFLRADEPGRAQAASLLDRYEALDRRISARILDPADSPGERARLGVDPVMGGVALEADETVEVVPAPIEQDITLGLARIVRGALPTVCLTTGHGELDPTSTLSNGASRAAGLLVDNGYPVVSVDLLAGGSLDDCGAVVVLGPVSPFGGAVDALGGHARSAEGRVGLFLESGFATGLEPMARSLGIEVLDGVVVEREPASVYAGDPTAPVIRRYSAASPVVRGLAPIFLVTTGGLEVGDGAVRLADTSPSSVLVDAVVGDERVSLDGPITVAAASEASANVDGRPRRRRFAVVADVDVVSNAFIGEAANGALLVQLVDWLTVDDDLVSVSSNLARPRPLALTQARLDYARLLTSVLVPGAFVVLGGLVWAVRRRW